MSIADEIQKLDQLRQSGVLSEEEFQTAKTRLLKSAGGGFGDSFDRVLDSVGLGQGLDSAERSQTYSMWLHLSMLTNLAAPGAGYVLPVVLWQTRKEDPIVDEHGRNALNFQICQLILAVLGAILAFFVVGFFLLFGCLIMSIVCPILVGLKAKRGIIEKYPLTYDFIKAPKIR